MIHHVLITEVYAPNREKLQEQLNSLAGRIIQVTPTHDDMYEVIYEIKENT